MKNLLFAFIFTISMAAISFGQTVVNSGAQLELHGNKPRIAVLEFTADSSYPAARANNLKQISLAVVEEMSKRDKDHKGWIEIPSTSLGVREYYKQYLGRPIDTATAVKIGKLLGVNYVMTGHVKVFDGTNLSLQTRMVKVSDGMIVWTGPSVTGGDWNGDGTVTSSDHRPAVHKLTTSLKDAAL